MKIKIMLCLRDQEYAERLLNYFNIRYGDKLDLHAFSECKILLEAINTGNIADVIMVDDEKDKALLSDSIAKDIPVLYVSEESSTTGVPVEDVVFKYQRGELLYKAVLNHYDGDRTMAGLCKKREGIPQVYCFLSMSGGTGSSTIAAAFVRYLARNKKVLYLNLETYGSADLYFEGEGNFSFDDVLYALKSKRGSVAVKLESAVKRSKENVYFYSATHNANDMQELTIDEWKQLFDVIEQEGGYDAIVMDIPALQNEFLAECGKHADVIYAIEDGTEVGNQKFKRYIDALTVFEKKYNISIVSKMRIFYNKFSNKTSMEIQYQEVKAVGGIQRYEKTPYMEIIEKISEKAEMQKLTIA